MSALADAYAALLAAATTVADADGTVPPPEGEWDAERILAHVSLVSGVTLAAVAAVTSGVNTTYDNRVALDIWTIDHLVGLSGGSEGLRDRLRRQGEAVDDLGAAMLTEAELATAIPTRLLSHDTLVVDQVLTLADLLQGLAEGELPGHTRQLLALLPAGRPDHP